jgi:hypothetical protein
LVKRWLVVEELTRLVTLTVNSLVEARHTALYSTQNVEDFVDVELSRCGVDR